MTIREDQAKLEQMLLQGITSGSKTMTPEYWQQLLEDAFQRIAERRLDDKQSWVDIWKNSALG